MPTKQVLMPGSNVNPESHRDAVLSRFREPAVGELAGLCANHAPANALLAKARELWRSLLGESGRYAWLLKDVSQAVA